MNPKTTPHFFARAPLPEILTLGTMIMDPVWSQKMHDTKYCELIHITRGTMELVTSRGSIRGVAGDTLLVQAGMFHRDEFDPHSGLEVFMLFFDWKAQDAFFKTIDFCRLPTLSASAKQEIARIIGQIKADMTGGGEADLFLIRSRLLTILLEIYRAQHAGGTGHEMRSGGRARHKWLMEQAQKYIHRHFAGEISLDGVARALKISPFYLSHIFSQESDLSLSAYVTSVRMHKARELLASGTVNISETAYAVGYTDSHYFSKVFRRFFGVPPTAARTPRTSATFSTK